MTTIPFQNKTLERQFRGFKWARNNTLQILREAERHNLFEFQPAGLGQHTVEYQFQCLITTTDTYYRKLKGGKDVQFGVMIRDDETTLKGDIDRAAMKQLLTTQLNELQTLLHTFTDEVFEMNAQAIQSIVNHEYLHQGQLVVMFREAGIALPERFKDAFDL